MNSVNSLHFGKFWLDLNLTTLLCYINIQKQICSGITKSLTTESYKIDSCALKTKLSIQVRIYIKINVIVSIFLNCTELF